MNRSYPRRIKQAVAVLVAAGNTSPYDESIVFKTPCLKSLRPEIG